MLAMRGAPHATPVTPAPAATVVVLRDGQAGLEVYLQRRTMAMGYAAGLWVFPGGRVDPADQDPALEAWWSGPGPVAWAARLGLGLAEARGTVVAACRECLEEAGVLLADPTPDPAALAAARQDLLAGGRSFGQVLAALGVRLDSARLRYWAWWVTPEAEPRRYDTRFFVAGLPAGAAATVHGLEAEREHWHPVRTAPAGPLLDADAQAPAGMLPPTWCTLRELAAFSSVSEVLAAAGDRTVERILPVHHDDVVVLPSGERIPLPPGALGRRP
jgi:8-oxo-dGTP pyrophosphatase MutT (NUDIX family)